MRVVKLNSIAFYLVRRAGVDIKYLKETRGFRFKNCLLFFSWNFSFANNKLKQKERKHKVDGSMNSGRCADISYIFLLT